MNLVRERLRDIVGAAGVALIVVGVWGLAGWQWAAIVAGLPVAGFWLWGQIRAAQMMGAD